MNIKHSVKMHIEYGPAILRLMRFLLFIPMTGAHLSRRRPAPRSCYRDSYAPAGGRSTARRRPGDILARSAAACCASARSVRKRRLGKPRPNDWRTAILKNSPTSESEYPRSRNSARRSGILTRAQSLSKSSSVQKSLCRCAMTSITRDIAHARRGLCPSQTRPRRIQWHRRLRSYHVADVQSLPSPERFVKGHHPGSPGQSHLN